MSVFAERRNIMDNFFNNSISIERFAAYLDENLSAAEMHEMDLLVSSNTQMEELVTVSDIVDENINIGFHNELDYESDMLVIDEQDFEIPILEELNEDVLTFKLADNFLNENIKDLDVHIIDDDAFSNHYDSNEIQNNINNFNNSLTMEGNRTTNDLMGAMAASSIYGEEGMGIQDAMIYQGNEGICAIRSQQIILRDYGIDISIEELKQFAIQNGWYDPSPNGGTPMWAIGNLLASCNVDCRQQSNCTIYDLVNELSQGHRVIVGVDANELWASRNGDTIEGAKEWFKDFFKGETPNHALIVAGVEVNPDDPQDVSVILTDPGTGDLRIEYDLDEFMDAWEDSHCFMTTTTTPAPLQYDPVKGCEVPSNFAVEQFVDANSLPLNPNNVILPGEMAAMCAEPYYEEGHLESIPIDDHDIDFDTYTASVAKAQQYKSVIGGGSHLPGQDHFDSKAFISSLKSMLGISSEADGHDDGYDDGTDGGYDDGTDGGYDDGTDGGYDDGTDGDYDDGSDDEPDDDGCDDNDGDDDGLFNFF